MDCSERCGAHKDTKNRLHVLERKYKVVEENTNTVSRLSDKVSLLLTVLGIIIFLVSAGAIYTYTGVNDFEHKYSDDMLTLHEELTKMNDANRDLIIFSIDNVEESINGRIDTLDSRMDKVTIDMTRIETQLKGYHDSLPQNK